MQRNIIWLMVSCLMALSLVLASCAPAAAPEKVSPKVTTKTEKVATPKKAAPEEKVAAVDPDKPRYGGTLRMGIHRADIMDSMDQKFTGSAAWRIPNTLTHGELLIGDWTMRNGIGGEASFQLSNFTPAGVFQHTGHHAESWEIVDEGTIKYKIRKGTYWHNKPPVNGREVTPADVVFSFKRFYMPTDRTTYGQTSFSGGGKMTDVYIDPNDSRTVVMEFIGPAGMVFEDLSDKTWLMPPEVDEEYGNQVDWHNHLGSGPFMLTDYVPDSSITFVKSSNYWVTNPDGPGKGDRLPYLDGINALILLDKATRMAALRTGKIDWTMTQVTGEDVNSLSATNPDILTRGLGQAQNKIVIPSNDFTAEGGRWKPNPMAEPLQDQKVRWALSMAIDRKSITEDYFLGFADEISWFFRPGDKFFPDLEDWPKIMEEAHGFSPEDAAMAKTMMEFHPDTAKKLLAEAGYPDGFTTSLLIIEIDVEYANLLVSMFADIGVDVKLIVAEKTKFRSLTGKRAYEALHLRSGTMVGWAERWAYLSPPDKESSRRNSNTNDYWDAYVSPAMGRGYDVYSDVEARNAIIRDYIPYTMWQGWWINVPAPWNFVVWQPWIKNYTGEDSVGYRNTKSFAQFVWLDLDLKEDMTGRR